MSAPSLFFGAADGRLLRLGEGDDDAGVPIEYRAETAPVAPAGPGGETLFRRLRLVCSWQVPTVLTVTPIPDGAATAPLEIVLTERSERTTERFRLGLSLPRTRFGAVVGTTGMRGVWLAVRVETASPADVLIEALELEHRVLRDARVAENVQGAA